jgi:hypothetical protein
MSSYNNQMIRDDNLDENNQQDAILSTKEEPAEQQQQQRQQQWQQHQAGSDNELLLLAEGPSGEGGAGGTSEQLASGAGQPGAVRERTNQEVADWQPQQRAHFRAKFIKSKSSPSSLTTHKFGLRPTPSPPRLIIDHQTGDIVESYPERPVYLRTYQPIEPDEDDERNDGERARSLQVEARISSSAGRQQHNKCLANNSVQHHNQHHSRPTNDNHASSDQSNHHRMAHNQRPAGVPAPPHAAAKVYFAPPATGSPSFGDQPPAAAAPSSSSSSRERARASFRRAINQLTEAERTDIAIVTEPDDYEGAGGGGRPPAEVRVTATSASKGDALLAARQQQRRQQPPSAASQLYEQPALRRAAGPHQQHAKHASNGAGKEGAAPETKIDKPPAIEHFGLYGFCFSLRVLLVLLLSASIVYLLAVNLHADCAKYRPASTYVSMITSSVNIISVTIFTLFWYCNGVTRTLYQNISASAFMVTIYSIMVAINLALAITFFFIDTCHFQKMLATHSAQAEWERPLIGAGSEDLLAVDGHRARRALHDERLPPGVAITGTLDSIGQHHSRREAPEHGRQAQKWPRALALSLNHDDPNVIDDQLANQDQDQDQDQFVAPSTTAAPASTTTATVDDAGYSHEAGYHERAPPMSPIEAGWEYVKERARAFGRAFYKFLLVYDLKFIGALHALLAACFQYLAIKLAVARSYFSYASARAAAPVAAASA